MHTILMHGDEGLSEVLVVGEFSSWTSPLSQLIGVLLELVGLFLPIIILVVVAFLGASIFLKSDVKDKKSAVMPRSLLAISALALLGAISFAIAYLWLGPAVFQ